MYLGYGDELEKDLEAMLKGTYRKKKPDLTIVPMRHMYVARFKSNPNRAAIGSTEKEALDNLGQFYKNVK